MTKHVTEIFNQFCKERHAEDKKRNYDLLQEIYASTEFFDTSFLETDYTKKLELFCKISRDTYRAYFPITNLSLPFANNFVKIRDDMGLFIREYAPNIITGSLYTHVNVTDTETMSMNFPFTIRLEGEYSTICSDFYEKNIEEHLEKLMESSFHVIIGICETLNELSKKSVFVDKPNKPKTEYYRRKNAPTIRVPQRPIYYILDKSEETKPKKLHEIRTIGTLEYTHAFKVRGHYRRISPYSLGKDRNGVYKVLGYTWVTEYIKGEGELSKRIRVLK